MKNSNEYDVKLDKRRRITLRNPKFRHYNVKIYSDGKVIMEPRYLARLDELSEETLKNLRLIK